MSKVERLNARVAKLLTAAVQEVLEVVRETVTEYQEKTARTQRENERLRRKVLELQDKQKRENRDEEATTCEAGEEGMPELLEMDIIVKQEPSSNLQEDTEKGLESDMTSIVNMNSPMAPQDTLAPKETVAHKAGLEDSDDQDEVCFVASYKTAAAAAQGSTTCSNQKLTVECKDEMKCNNIDDTSSLDTKPFKDKDLLGDMNTHKQTLIHEVDKQLVPSRRPSNSSDINSALDACPPSPSLMFRPGGVEQTLLTASQIKVEVDEPEDSSNGALCRPDYIDVGLDGLGGLLQGAHEVHMATVAADTAASTSCRMLYGPAVASSLPDGMFVENGFQVTFDPFLESEAGQFNTQGPLNRRGPGGGRGGNNAGLGLSRLPRPYTRRYNSHAAGSTPPKRYCCGVCGRSFNHAGDFKKHKRVHTGERPYGCGICGKRFSQSGYLTVHLRHHTGERPYTCTYCGRSFSHSSNFRKHQQTHVARMITNT